MLVACARVVFWPRLVKHTVAIVVQNTMVSDILEIVRGRLFLLKLRWGEVR